LRPEDFDLLTGEPIPSLAEPDPDEPVYSEQQVAEFGEQVRLDYIRERAEAQARELKKRQEEAAAAKEKITQPKSKRGPPPYPEPRRPPGWPVPVFDWGRNQWGSSHKYGRRRGRVCQVPDR
jgi:hypothetical protein